MYCQGMIRLMLVAALLVACPGMLPPSPATTGGESMSTGISTTAHPTSGNSNSETGAVETGDSCSIETGKAFGPCRIDSTCDAPFTCALTAVGTICQPPCDECTNAVHDACVKSLSEPGRFTCVMPSLCQLPCVTDAECAGGTICATTENLCVWPSSG